MEKWNELTGFTLLKLPLSGAVQWSMENEGCSTILSCTGVKIFNVPKITIPSREIHDLHGESNTIMKNVLRPWGQADVAKVEHEGKSQVKIQDGDHYNNTCSKTYPKPKKNQSKKQQKETKTILKVD